MVPDEVKNSPPIVLNEAAVAAAVVGGREVQTLERQTHDEKQREERQSREDFAELAVDVLRVQPALS